jgi:hypothetical protein
MMGLFKRRKQQPVHPVARAVMETLEERRLLSTPHVLPAGPREARADYIPPQYQFPTAPEYFEWEFLSPKLVFPFDQPVSGVSNQTHSLMTLYNQTIQLSGDTYPSTIPAQVIEVPDFFDGTLTSTDGGVTWSGSDETSTITLQTNVARPHFTLTAVDGDSSASWNFDWDGYDAITNTTRVSYAGQYGSMFRIYKFGTSGWIVAPDPNAQGTTVPLSNPTFNAAGDTATFALPTDLPTGNYESILSSPGITDMGGANHLDGNATTTELDPDHEDFVYPFFIMRGDANHDRVINIDDYGTIDRNVGQSGSVFGYFNGDFNYDQLINSDDYYIIDHNFGTVLPPMPTAPNSLIANAARDLQTGQNYIDLNWVPPTDLPDIDGYGIWCSTDGGVTFNLLQFVDDGAATSWRHNNLPDGSKFTYRIRAHTPSGGYSTTSNKYSAVTNLPPPTNPAVDDVTATTATVSWDDTTVNESGFEIAVLDGNHAYQETIYQAPGYEGTGRRSFTITGLSPNDSFILLIRAKTAAQVSAWTQEVDFNTPQLQPPETPSGLIATAISDSQIDLSWQDNSADDAGFKVERSLDGNNNWTEIGTASTPVFSDVGLPENTYRYYRVRATNAAGDSPYSNVVYAYTQPKAPTNLSATFISGGQIDLSWTNNSSASPTFYIEQSTAGQPWQAVGYAYNGASSYSAQGPFDPSTTYSFRVRAAYYVLSSYSNVASAETTAYPIAPSNFTATAISDSEIDLSWQDNSNNEDGFEVEKSTDYYNGPWTSAGVTGQNLTSIPVTGLDEGKSYYFRVRAKNAAGASAFAPIAWAQTPWVPPTIVSPATASETEVTGTTDTLSVLGAVAGHPESDLTYYWTVLPPRAHTPHSRRTIPTRRRTRPSPSPPREVTHFARRSIAARRV